MISKDNSIFACNRILKVCLLLIAWGISVLILYASIEADYEAKIVDLAENGLASSISSFNAFADMGYNEDYYSGVASFKHYVETISCYESQNGYQSVAAYSEGIKIIGIFINNPECAKEHMQDVVGTLNAVCDDITSADVHLRLAELKNILIEKGSFDND